MEGSRNGHWERRQGPEDQAGWGVGMEDWIRGKRQGQKDRDGKGIQIGVEGWDRHRNSL